MKVTSVVPAYNEGDGLCRFLEAWASEGSRCTSLAASLIVVDDGSDAQHDARQREGVAAAAGLLREAGSPHAISYVRSDRNRGKGASIRLGWSRADADADWLGFIDGDGALPAREYWRVAALLGATDADALCGSRVKMAGREIERSLFRHLQGRVFATVVEEVFHLGFYDTQCGFKFFRESLLRPLLPRLQEQRWLLDIEVLDLMRAAGARFVEIPVDCYQRGGSSLVFAIDPLKMALRLLSLRRRLRREKGAARS